MGPSATRILIWVSADLTQINWVRPVAKGSRVKPQRFSGEGNWKVGDYISGINAPKYIISTPKPHKLQSVAKRSLMNAHCGYVSMRSSRHVWTIATDCLRTAAWPFVKGFSEFRTALLVWYVQNLLLATLHHCCAGYTGYQLPGV